MPTERNPETGSTSLKRMILDQAMEATAIPMALFSSDTLAGGDGPATMTVRTSAATTPERRPRPVLTRPSDPSPTWPG